MFDWLGDLLGNAFGSLGQQISSAIFDVMMKWIYEQIYNAVADFFTQMGNMGAEIFDLGVVQSTISLFTLFGWALFAAGTVVAVFDVAVEYQNGRASIKTTAINILKGFFACSLIGIVPVELYKFCISLQNSLAKDLSLLNSSGKSLGLAEESTELWKGAFALTNNVSFSLFNILAMIAFAYCVVKIFFANIKRGGMLLTQIAVGSLYMFSIPKGNTDGFISWCRQVIALCVTAFLQMTLLYLGLLTWKDNMLLGLGVMLAANEVPNIAKQFGLDTSVKVHLTSAVHSTAMAVNMVRAVARR